MADFKTKRIEYINNWPNADKFDVERQYEEKYKSVNNGVPFIPFRMTVNFDESYNKAVSFMIDAISLERRPNHSFEFMFIAYDIYSKSVTSFDNITDRTQTLVHVWNTLIQSDRAIGTRIVLERIRTMAKKCTRSERQICAWRNHSRRST